MAFNPLSISGCMCWYNPNILSTLTMVSGGVQSITDLSGNGRTATSLGSPRPTISNLGGLNALSFSRTAATKGLATATVNQAQPATGFCVVKQDVLGGGGNFFSFVGSNQTAFGPDFANDFGHFALGEWVGGFDGSVEDTLPHVFSYVVNGASSFLWMDGNLVGAGDSGANGWASSNITLGEDVNGTNGSFTGQLGEVLWYNSVLSTANRVAMEEYLLTNWVYGGFRGFESGTGESISTPGGFH